MRAVILAGGLGTRLRPYTTIIPKPLVPIGDRPILEHIIHRLAACGVDQVDLCVSHLGSLIEVYFSQAADLPDDLALKWHWEDRPLGTAGAISLVPDLDDTFIAMNGDILTTLNYADLVDFHRREGAALTIAVRKKDVPLDLGVIETDGDVVTGYREKPVLGYEVSTGIYVYEPRALQYLTPGIECQFPDLVLRLLAAGEHVAAFRTNAPWYDIGTPSEYDAAVRDYELFIEVAEATPTVTALASDGLTEINGSTGAGVKTT